MFPSLASTLGTHKLQFLMFHRVASVSARSVTYLAGISSKAKQKNPSGISLASLQILSCSPAAKNNFPPENFNYGEPPPVLSEQLHGRPTGGLQNGLAQNGSAGSPKKGQTENDIETRPTISNAFPPLLRSCCIAGDER